MNPPHRPIDPRGTLRLIRPLVLLALLASLLAAPVGPTRGTARAIAAVPLSFTSIDTMKESRDTETHPLSDAQIADDVDLAVSLQPAYITVDTHWEYPDYMRRWVQAVRATGRHVWFRIHPNQWGNNNGTIGIMTPAVYEDAERAFLQANVSLFQPGDILDPCPEPENGLYWRAAYRSGWTANAPNTATREYNAFIRDTTDVADTALHQAGIYGVITTVRSTNSFFAAHPGPLEAETVTRMGRVTVDSYPEGTTTDPATAAAARLGELQSIEAAWGVPVVIGELGYSDRVPVDDQTQAQVLAAEFAALTTLPYLEGLNYWVGAGTDNSGGYTHLFAGSTGAWTVRPAAALVAAFFAPGTTPPSAPTPATITPIPTGTAPDTLTPTTSATAPNTAPPIASQTPAGTSPAATTTATPSARTTITPSATATSTPTATASLTRTSTRTTTPTNSPTASPTASASPTRTPAATPTAPSSSSTPTATQMPATPGACPSPWHCTDIGAPDLPGSQSLAAGAWSVAGAGEDIWGTASQFRYIFRIVHGDREISARVLAQSVTSPWAKAGLMLSQSANPSSPYYALFVTPAHGVSVQYRARQGGNASDLMLVPLGPPVFLRVARSGAQFSAYTSIDGRAWTEVPGSRIALALPETMFGGPAVTSHNTAERSTASFDSVVLSATTP